MFLFLSLNGLRQIRFRRLTIGSDGHDLSCLSSAAFLTNQGHGTHRRKADLDHVMDHMARHLPCYGRVMFLGTLLHWRQILYRIIL